MAKKKRKIAMWQIISVVLLFIAISFNIRASGKYNLELAIGLLILGLIKIWEDFLKK